MGSSRLPGKVLADVCGKPLLQRVLEAVAGPWRVVVLTSKSRADSQLCAWCRESGVEYRRGSLPDVLSRYSDLAVELQPSHLVRVCGDAPFLEASWIAKATSREGPCFVPGALHTGSWEVWGQVSESPEPDDWEHAGYYWFRDNARHLELVPESYMTVNTPEDLEEARRRFGSRSEAT
jgi:CMP-2-keto-3-deoxyoctulosonic acid synthetase